MRNIPVFVYCNILCISIPIVSLVTAAQPQAKKCKTAVLLIYSLQKLQGFLRSTVATVAPTLQAARLPCCRYWFRKLPLTAESFAMDVVYIQCRKNRLHISKVEMRVGEQR